MKFINRLLNFLARIRVAMFVVVAAAVVFFVGYFAWTGWSRRALSNSTLLAEEAQTQFESWQGAEEGGEKSQMEADLREKLNLIIRKYPHQYGTQRALFIRAHLAALKKDWKAAVEDFTDLARSFPRSYLAALSLFNAAVAFEEQDNVDQALGQYQDLIRSYPDSYLMPHALFSVGRLQEQKGDFTQAAAAYNRLIDEHSTSNWTKAGRNRIIDLQNQGKITE
jgi:TolA-binding protein